MSKDYGIERKIIIAMIVSTDFIRELRPVWNPRFIESQMARLLAIWCVEYFDKYNRAPVRDIEGLYLEKLKGGRISEEMAEEIEQDILPNLNKQFYVEGLNIEYLLDQTNSYFNEQNLLLFSKEIQGLINSNRVLDAENLASSYKPIVKGLGDWVDLSDRESVFKEITNVFSEKAKPLIEFQGALGDFWNDQLVRGGFVALMGSEKRGKTFWLLEFGFKAAENRQKVAFFQAGDMTKKEQLARICTYLTRKSIKKKYTGKMFQPIKDCIHNQTDQCDREEREGISKLFNEKKTRNQVEFKELVEFWKENKEHLPCTNCKEFQKNKWTTPWIKEVDVGGPLTEKEAKLAVDKFFIRNQRNFRLSSHINSTLTVKEIKSILDIWEKQDGFIPDVIIIDYADLLEDTSKKDERHKQNQIWKDLRGLSQERHALVITATQADSDSYDRDLLTMGNFSEDKRKYGHVTAMYGLNQSKDGREKELGIMRINGITLREAESNIHHQVYVLQNLKRGRPFLSSYW